MKMQINAIRPRHLSAARQRYYDRLAEHFVQEVGSGRVRTILEAGCGRGQLTIPLLWKLPTSARMIAVDSSKGPHAGCLNELATKLHGRGFHSCRVTYFDTTIHLGYENAVEELRTWGWTERLLKRNDKLLKQQGIEIPFEHVVRCEKEKHGSTVRA